MTRTEANPFMLMLHPEVVLAAMAKSEKLGRLNRHLCRPLDRPLTVPPGLSLAGGHSGPMLAPSADGGTETDDSEDRFSED